MPRSREEEAGALYAQGLEAVKTGGHELTMLAGHLVLMIRGTVDFKGPLWPVRLVPPEGKEIHLDRFEDYLRKPAREGLGLPSFHFLRQVLKASPKGTDTLDLVRAELAKEHVDFNAVADREHSTELLKREVGQTGVHHKGNNLLPLSKGNTERQAARLATRRPDLAEAVRSGRMTLPAALIEAGIRKKPVKLTHCPHCGGKL